MKHTVWRVLLITKKNREKSKEKDNSQKYYNTKNNPTASEPKRPPNFNDAEYLAFIT